jgi:hypothetical protein
MESNLTWNAGAGMDSAPQIWNTEDQSRAVLSLKRVVLAGCVGMGLTLGVTRSEPPFPVPQSISHSGAEAARQAAQARFFASLPPGFQIPKAADEVGKWLLACYGAVLVARGGVTPPPVLVFPDEDSVARWRSSVKTSRVEINKTVIELQNAALAALMEARQEARKAKLDITPRGTDPAGRTYADSVVLWTGRVKPGLKYWVKQGRLDRREAQRIVSLPLPDQVLEILRLEHQGLFLSKDPAKSIFASVAPPGASQHFSMLALDIKENANPAVRSILARHGWYQTVLFDLPHFTYLGVVETELPSLGLWKVRRGKRVYWIPDLGVPLEKKLRGPDQGRVKNPH